MTSRQRKILDLLSEHEFLTSQRIAGLLHVSDRTVRNDIREINAELGMEGILSRMGLGYYLKDHGMESGEVAAGLESEEDLKREIVRSVLFKKKRFLIWNLQMRFISVILCLQSWWDRSTGIWSEDGADGGYTRKTVIWYWSFLRLRSGIITAIL